MKTILCAVFVLLLCAPVGAEPNDSKGFWVDAPKSAAQAQRDDFQLIRGDDPSMWVLVFFVGHTYFVDPKNYPAWDVRVFAKEGDCDAAALALNKGIDVDRDYRGKDYAYRWYECVYEPEWLDQPWHAYPEIRHGWGERMKAWWNARIYGFEELWRTK